MTTTTDLSPAPDATSDVSLSPQQQPGSHLTLYHLANDLVSLLALREEMAEEKEATDVADAAIAEYMEQLPAKVDDVVHVLRSLESQAELAASEVQRLTARRRRIASAAESLRQYCCNALALLPKPKKGSRKLEGQTASLVLKGNGGLEPLDIYDEALVPDDYCTATVTLPWNLWLVLRESISVEDFPKSIRSVDSAAVRKALAEPCWVCEGTGQGNDIGTDRDGEAISGSCTSCGGSGKAGVPGCALRDRGFHLEIR